MSKFCVQVKDSITRSGNSALMVGVALYSQEWGEVRLGKLWVGETDTTQMRAHIQMPSLATWSSPTLALPSTNPIPAFKKTKW